MHSGLEYGVPQENSDNFSYIKSFLLNIVTATSNAILRFILNLQTFVTFLMYLSDILLINIFINKILKINIKILN